MIVALEEAKYKLIALRDELVELGSALKIEEVEAKAAALEARDYRAMQFLDWFIKEQGEEETNANDLISKYELYGGDAQGLYLLNQELAARVYSAPSLVL